MASTGFQAQPGWQWPNDPPNQRTQPQPAGSFPEIEHEPDSGSPSSVPSPDTQPQGAEQSNTQQKHWRPRTCRICLETVNPTYNPPETNVPGVFQPRPNIIYEDEDGGRLIRPCKCKGSSKYVHENCLQAWRHADPSYGNRNFWECPTCRFRYRLQRVTWGRLISSAAAQIVLTCSVFIMAIFLLGFIADPIIKLYLDPVGSFSWRSYGDEYFHYYPAEEENEQPSWALHFLKGFASLGIIGAIKAWLTSPWNFINIRIGGGGRARVGRTGRERLENVSWIVLAIGIATVLYGIWTSVRAWCRRTLERAGEIVMDVQGDDGDDEEEEGEGSQNGREDPTNGAQPGT